MKNLILILSVCTLTSVNAAVPGCYNWDTKCIEKEYQRQQALDDDIANHRKWMQSQINVAVEKQREVDKIIRNQPKAGARELIAEACRQISIQEAQLRFGYIKSSFYASSYGACLKSNGISYD